MPEPLDVQVSIVNTHNRERLRACLDSLPEGCRGLRWLATVVGSASLDGSAELVETGFPDVRLIRNDRRLGISTNHNAALREVIDSGGARYILPMHEDVELTTGSVRRLVEHCDAHPEAESAPSLLPSSADSGPSRMRCGWTHPARSSASTRCAEGRALRRAFPCGAPALRRLAVRVVPRSDGRIPPARDLGPERPARGGGAPHAAQRLPLLPQALGGAPSRGGCGPRPSPLASTRCQGGTARALAGDAAERSHGRYLLSLARYDPRKPLPLEEVRR
jgi:hypothetical protein